MRSATIYDVAREAGVSIKTVSRVLNNEPNVRPAMRDRVTTAAQKLGYRPSLSARSLAGSRSFVIAAFVDAALTIEHWQGERSTDYITRVQLGATTECRKAGRHFMIELIDRDPSQVRREIQDVLGALKPDGVLLTPPSSDDVAVLEILAESGVPFVRLGAETHFRGGLRLTMADEAAARALTEHLIAEGHRTIGCVTGPDQYAASLARLDGYCAASKQHGLAASPGLIQPGDFTFNSGYAAVESFLKLDPRPTAIIASNDDMALGCLAALTEAGVHVPRDISVAGFDDSAGSRSARPALTTVRQPLTELAAIGVQALIEGKVSVLKETTASAPAEFKLMVRGSTAPPSR